MQCTTNFNLILAFLLSYLLGSIPTAYIFGRVLRGIDIRKFGSGNVGTTNAFRVLGKRVGIIVFIIDVLKGIIPVLFLSNFIVLRPVFLSANMLAILLGLVAVAGHNWTIFLQFKGGKGVATTLGVLIGLAFKVPGFHFVLLSSIILWVLILLISRTVSISSVLTATLFPILMLIFQQSKELLIFGFIFAAFIILRHKSNIQRILKGTESKIK